MLLNCTCKHEYQDSAYGKGMRVCNKLGAKKPAGTYRCTVCGKERQTSNADKKE